MFLRSFSTMGNWTMVAKLSPPVYEEDWTMGIEAARAAYEASKQVRSLTGLLCVIEQTPGGSAEHDLPDATLETIADEARQELAVEEVRLEAFSELAGQTLGRNVLGVSFHDSSVSFDPQSSDTNAILFDTRH